MTGKKSKYAGKTNEKVKEKIKKKTEEKKKKKTDRNTKLQEKKQLRVKQMNEKKMVSGIVEIFRTIFPEFTENENLRKYFNLNQFIKLEMFPDFEEMKGKYSGDNSVFEPIALNIAKNVFGLVKTSMSEEEYVKEICETHIDKFNELLILYIKS